jgi:hypothetical protein
MSLFAAQRLVDGDANGRLTYAGSLGPSQQWKADRCVQDHKCLWLLRYYKAVTAAQSQVENKSRLKVTIQTDKKPVIKAYR